MSTLQMDRVLRNAEMHTLFFVQPADTSILLGLHCISCHMPPMSPCHWTDLGSTVWPGLGDLDLQLAMGTGWSGA